MSGSVRIAAVQHDIAWCDRDANFERLAPMVATAAGAVLLASINIFGGFAVTRRMLAMFQKGNQK